MTFSTTSTPTSPDAAIGWRGFNQVEIWLSILPGAVLKGASFTSPREPREVIDEFVPAYN